MANTKQTKKYLGGWDTSAYEDLSRASRQSYETNWDIIKERFNNLLAEQDARQQEAVRNYNNTLANQTNAMFNAQRAVDQNLANRGVADSGVRSLIGQEQTRGVGGNVNTALSKLMDTTSDTVNAQLGGIGDLLNSGNKLNQRQLADQLDIVADKQAADMEGQQLAAQLAENEAARRARGGSGSGIDEEANEEARRLAVYSILNNIDPSTGEPLNVTDSTKAYLLKNIYDVKNAPNVIKLYDNRIQGQEGIDKLKKDLEKAQTKVQKNYKSANFDKYWDEAANLNEAYNTMLDIYHMPLNQYFDTIYAKRG